MRPLEDIDLAVLADDLQATFAKTPPLGYLAGKTALRDAVARSLQCSELVAEELVDTMIARGFLAYPRDSEEQSVPALLPWRFVPTAS